MCSTPWPQNKCLFQVTIASISIWFQPLSSLCLVNTSTCLSYIWLHYALPHYTMFPIKALPHKHMEMNLPSAAHWLYLPALLSVFRSRLPPIVSAALHSHYWPLLVETKIDQSITFVHVGRVRNWNSLGHNSYTTLISSWNFTLENITQKAETRICCLFTL